MPPLFSSQVLVYISSLIIGYWCSRVVGTGLAAKRETGDFSRNYASIVPKLPNEYQTCWKLIGCVRGKLKNNFCVQMKLWHQALQGGSSTACQSLQTCFFPPCCWGCVAEPHGGSRLKTGAYWWRCPSLPSASHRHHFPSSQQGALQLYRRRLRYHVGL